MALQGGHRFVVSMDEVFPAGVYAVGVVQAEEFIEKNGRLQGVPAKDPLTGELVWTVTCMDRDTDARTREVKVKISAPVMPAMPPEVLPDSGLSPVEFTGLTATPWVQEGGPRSRSRLMYSFRATGMHEQGKAPRSQQPAAPAAGSSRSTSGDGKAA